MALDDRTLWSRARDGDAEAFGVLFDRHAKLIYNYCFRRTGDWAVAEDLVSIVFLESWRLHHKVIPDKGLPWLFGIATNVVRNRRRAARRYTAALGRMPPPSATPDFSADAVDRLDDERVTRDVLARIAELPRREQDVLVLCAGFELSYEDAAVALGVPLGTIRSRLSRAKRRLRELDAAVGHDNRRKPVGTRIGPSER